MRRRTSSLYDCDRCKFTFKKSQLKKQRGMYLCDGCFDSVLEIAPLNVKFESPRADGTSITAVNTPTVFTVTTAGITALSKSYTQTRMREEYVFIMQVVGSPTTITANPQIVSAQGGTVLTLVGTDSTNYVVLQAGNGTDLTTSMRLDRGAMITLVYSSASSLWCEASRLIGGVI